MFSQHFYQSGASKPGMEGSITSFLQGGRSGTVCACVTCTPVLLRSLGPTGETTGVGDVHEDAFGAVGRTVFPSLFSALTLHPTQPE